MKRVKKLLAFLMTVILVVSVSIMPVEAATSSQYKTKHPIVFVHGLFGYGDYDGLTSVVPYWGYTSGSMPKYLAGFGTESYSASVGPISSAWDRACELYAQLTGTVTDYGAKHAAEHGHDRYGRDYTEKGYGRLMKKEWNADNPINLVGHSFGGVTSRLLIQFLAEGNADEQAYMAAHPELGEISPLFTGGKADWVYSLTTLAAPSNGSSMEEAFSNILDLVSDVVSAAGTALSLTSFKGVYDFQLEHFGIYSKSGESLASAMNRVFNKSSFISHNDNALVDLSVDKAIDINKDINMQNNIYYFSYYGDRTKRNILTGKYIPTARMFLPLQVTGLGMGILSGSTAGSYKYGYGKYATTVKVTKTNLGSSTWRRNDGAVPVESGQYPFHYENGKRVDDPHVASKVGVKATKKGVWYVMPCVDYDHLSFCGGILNETRSTTQAFYRGLVSNIVNCGG